MLDDQRPLTACGDHVRRYLQAPFLADRARAEAPAGGGPAGLWSDVVTAGVPPSLRRALEEWVTDDATPDEEIADFVGWPVGTVREHR